MVGARLLAVMICNESC